MVQHLGFPSLTFGAILSMWAGWLDSPMIRQHEEFETRQLAIYKVLQHNQHMIDQHAEKLDELIYVNQQSCIGVADSDEQRARCLEGPHN